MKCVSLNQAQFGFLKGRSTLDCLFLLREAILEARYYCTGIMGGKHQKLFAAFLDFKGAFDRMPRELLWSKLQMRFGISGKLLRVIIDLFSEITGHAVVNGLATRTVNIFSGVLQGSVLGPILFLLFIDDLVEALHESGLGIPLNKFIMSVLAYADDITLMSLKVDKLQSLLDICFTWAENNGMEFSLDKCFAVVFNSRSTKPEDLPLLKLGKYELESTFPDKTKDIYLAFNITNRVAKTKLGKDLKIAKLLVPSHRSSPNHKYLKYIIAKFNRARHGTYQLCQDKNILTPVISNRLYKSLQRSTLLYATEISDWDFEQIIVLEKLQSKSLRSLFDLDRQCPS